MKRISFIVFLLLTFAFMGCNSKFNRIIENKDKIVTRCYNKSMDSNPHRHSYYLETYNEDQLRNEYIFDRIEDKKDHYFVLRKDSIQFYPDNIIGVTPDGSELYRQQMCDYFKELSDLLHNYHIFWFTDNNNYGVPMPGVTFGLDNGQVLEYRPGTYVDLEDYRKFKDEWYLRNSQ